MHSCICVLCLFSTCVLLTSPDDRTLFMYSRKDSSLISLSVKMKLMPLPCWPAVLYKPFRSSIRLAVLYELAKNTMHHINMHFNVFFSDSAIVRPKKKDREKETVWGCVFVSVCSTSITVWINLTVWIIWVRSDVLFELRAPSQCAIVHHLYFSDSSGIHVASRNLLWLNYFEQLSANLALNMDILYGVLWWKQWGQKKWITHCLVTELCACVYVCAHMERCHLDFQVGRAFISGTGKEKVWTDWQISGLKGGEEASNVLAACFQMCLHLFFLCLCVNLNEL